MSVVLVVDDVPALCEQYAYDLKRIGGYGTLTATSGRQALDMLESEAVDCMVLDLEMPGMDGFEVLTRLAEERRTLPVIVYTSTGDFDRCVRAVKLGAHGFIDKSEPVERVAHEIANALERSRLRGEVSELRRRLGSESPLLGESPAMETLRTRIGKLAPIPSPVLILGESGTGKELVARALHTGSGRKGSFLAINCAALPENLVESELFGHEKGAFTGAERLRRGAFESAAGGTLFLDEIGELPQAMQAKMLRVLEESVVTRVGGTRTVAVTARVVAATNRNLDHEVTEGRFREDLLYRLNVHTVAVPPLRERLGDVPLLAARFVESVCANLGVRAKNLDPDATRVLKAYDWKRNNVRELRNIVERMVIAADGETIEAEHVPDEVLEGGPRPQGGGPAVTLKDRKLEAERGILVEALERNDWHITNTAKELGLADHASLLKIMRRHDLKRPGS